MKRALLWVGTQIVLGFIAVVDWLRYFGRGDKE